MINVQVSKVKYVRIHTQRQYQDCVVYYKDALDSPSNYGKRLALQALIGYIC